MGGSTLEQLAFLKAERFIELQQQHIFLSLLTCQRLTRNARCSRRVSSPSSKSSTLCNSYVALMMLSRICVPADIHAVLLSDMLLLLQEKDQKLVFASLVSSVQTLMSNDKL